MPNFHDSEQSEQKKALSRAQDCADRSDGIGMLQGLCDSLIFEGYERFFTRRYPELVDDVHDALGSATDDLFDRVMAGQKIIAIHSYMWKVTDRLLSHITNKRKIQIGGIETEQLPGIILREDVRERMARKTEECRDRALNIAESLIPRLGLTGVQAVMRYVLGSVRNGAQDLTSKEIADALGITPENARQAMKRGFERLARIVREEKLVDPSYKFPFFEDYTDEEDARAEEIDQTGDID